MKHTIFFFGIGLLTTCALARDTQLAERGKQEEQHSCIQCHSLRLVDSQRLSKAGWDKEVTKMIGWGAPVSDRQVLVDYLFQQYSADKPQPPLEFTGTAVKQKPATPSSK
jgi:mono/diheme cytochrome c family protein